MKRIVLAAALLVPVSAMAQVPPSRWTQNYIPTLRDWQAALLYKGQPFSAQFDEIAAQLVAINSQIGNVGTEIADINAALATKVAEQDGTSTNQTLNQPTIADGAITAASFTCENAAACVVSSLISYSPGWAKSVERTLLTRLEDTVSANDFGADPTGAADSSAAINAALAASGHVLLPCGTYSLKATVSLPASANLQGYGTCSVLRLDNGAAVGVQATASGASLRNVAIGRTTDRTADDIALIGATDTTLDGIVDADTGHAAYTGLHITNSAHVSISHSRFTTDSIAGYGIQVDGTTGPSTDVRIADVRTAGFLNGLNVSYAEGLSAANMQVSAAYGTGIAIQPDTANGVSLTLIAETVGDAWFTNVSSTGNTGDGWEIVGDGAVRGVHLVNCAGSSNGLSDGDQSYSANGFHQGNVNAVGVSITNSDFSLNYGNGVYVEGGDSILISANSINNNSLTESNGSHGVLVLDQTSNFTLSGNVIGYSSAYGSAKNQNWGAYVLAMDGVLVSGNIFRQNNGGGLHISASSTTYPNIINANNITD